MLILGLDPGSHLFGWGVIEPDGSKFKRIASGVLTLKDNKHLMVASRITEIVKQYEPAIAAVEVPFVHPKHRKDTAIILGQARGAALAALESCGLMVIDLMPTEVKELATGDGRADKGKVARWVQFQTGYYTKNEDESDALAVAIAGVMKQRKRRVLREVVK